jgi:pimeloyl-ACP methyl ester carboxylesterase
VLSTPDPAEPRFEYRAIGRLRLHCAVAGEQGRPLVILLHGFPEFWYAWRDYFEPLVRAGYRVIAPDQRGYNLSDKPKRVKDYAVEHLVDDVLELARWEGAETFNLVGHDWGAVVAWALAQRRPHAVRRMVAMNVPHPAVMKRHLTGNIDQLKRSWYMFFFQLPWIPELQLLRAGGETFYRRMAATSPRGCFGAEQREAYLRAWRQPGAMRAMLNWYRAAVRAGLSGHRIDGRIESPTSILWGRGDRNLHWSMAEESLDYCEDGVLRFFEDATHWVLHEEREAVLEELLLFLAD